MSVMMKSKQKVKPHQGETLLLNTWKNRSLLAMAIPVIVLLILFNYIPMFGLVVAFKDFNYTDGIFGSPWVGLKNFKFLFSMKDLTWRMLRNTIGYYLLFTAVGTVFNVALAVALNECYNKYFKKYSHTYYQEIPADLLQTELDTCWVNVGGENPAQYVRKYTGRAPIVHLKDFSGSKTENMYSLIGTDAAKEEASEKFEFRPIGYGRQDIPSILAASEDAGAGWVIVEQDSPSMGKTPMECAKMSIDYLKSIL